MDEILKKIYYDPESGLQGALALYQKARKVDPTIKRKDVDEWLKKQETAQLHQQRKEVKHYYPIKSNDPDHIWQIDLADFSKEAHNNKGVNFLLCCIDIWTRFAWVRPLKNKESKTVNAAFKSILPPQILMSDNGSEFTSRSWVKLVSDVEIKLSYAEVGDHHRLGIIDRFIQTLRGQLEKYMTAFHTKNYIDALDKIVKNYNTTEHSSLKATPSEVAADPEKFRKRIEARIADKEDRARNELTTFEIGDEVRSLKNKVTFEKGAVAKWSTQIHKVTGHLAGKRYILDNGNSYLYYQLKPTRDIEVAPQNNPSEISLLPREFLPPKKQRVALKKEGVEKANLREGLRERKPAVGVITNKGEKVLWTF